MFSYFYSELIFCRCNSKRISVFSHSDNTRLWVSFYFSFSKRFYNVYQFVSVYWRNIFNSDFSFIQTFFCHSTSRAQLCMLVSCQKIFLSKKIFSKCLAVWVMPFFFKQNIFTNRTNSNALFGMSVLIVHRFFVFVIYIIWAYI